MTCTVTEMTLGNLVKSLNLSGSSSQAVSVTTDSVTQIELHNSLQMLTFNKCFCI